MTPSTFDRLALLRIHDPFRTWESLDDKRLCLVCEKSFTGRDVIVRDGELHCPTPDCRSHVHEWVYPGNPSLSEEAFADWWAALSQPVLQEGPAS